LRRICAEVMQILSRELLEEDLCGDNADPITGLLEEDLCKGNGDLITGAAWGGSMQRLYRSYHGSCLRRIYAEVMQTLSWELLEEDLCRGNADPITGTGGRGSMQR
jgi:hypothetical protein